jgi:hypothetical protein
MGKFEKIKVGDLVRIQVGGKRRRVKVVTKHNLYMKVAPLTSVSKSSKMNENLRLYFNRVAFDTSLIVISKQEINSPGIYLPTVEKCQAENRL